MIYVVDAIMGAGKSQSAITYMNEHPDGHFIYITPYVGEAERIKNDCPELRFATPNHVYDTETHSKVAHTRSLIKKGRNVTTTHAAFRLYTDDMIESIREYQYTLIIDEAVAVMSEMEINAGDIELFEKAGVLKKEDDMTYVDGTRQYTGTLLRDLYTKIIHNDLIRIGDNFYCWELCNSVMDAFKDIFVLTYMFEGQDMSCYLKKRQMSYKYIGVKCDGGKFSFSDTTDYMPEYTEHLSEMIHICDVGSLNDIGKRQTSLSSSWYQRIDEDKVAKLKNNMYNFFRNYCHGHSKEVLWTAFKERQDLVAPRGYKDGFIPCTLRATNEYRDRKFLAYCVNVFANPFKKQYLSGIDTGYDDDAYALSNMVQWIWRSQIRDGKEIWIYIPSSRMRNLLIQWIADVENQYKVIMKQG